MVRQAPEELEAVGGLRGLVVGNYCHDVLIRNGRVVGERLGGAVSFLSNVLDNVSVPRHYVSKNIFLGAVDTSAVVLEWAMTELVKNPEVMMKLQDEIRSTVGKKGKVVEEDIEQLKFLKMVVKETLRLHSPVPLLIPRETMQHFTIKGYDIYPKTRVLVNVWAIGRDPKYWNKPEEFMPERFMDSSIDFKGTHFMLLPFGAGRRICPGMHMGIATVELTLANLMYNFDWGLPNGMKEEDIDVDETSGLLACKKSPIYLVPIEQNINSIII